MKVHSSVDQNNNQEPLAARNRSPLTLLFVALNAFVLGGCLALLLVNRLLKNQLDIYVSSQSMDAGSTMLDLMDDMLPIYMLCGSAVLLILLISITAIVWTKTQSRLLRYGSIILLLLLLIFLAGFWLVGSASAPVVPMQMPTPTPS